MEQMTVIGNVKHLPTYCKSQPNTFFEEYTQPERLAYLAKGSDLSKREMAEYNQSHVYLACLDNVTVFSPGFLITENNDIFIHGLSASHYPEAIDITLQPFTDHYCLDGLSLTIDAATEFDDEAVLLWGSSNFGHWVYQFLTRLATLQYRPELLKKKFIVPDYMPERFGEYFIKLGFTPEQLIYTSSTVKVKRLWVPSITCYRGHYNDRDVYVWPSAIKYLREGLLGERAYMDAAVRPPYTRFYVSRKNASWRRIINEELLIEKLTPYGFKAICYEELSVDEQLEITANADMMILSPGCGSIMTMFAAPNTTVLELNTDSIDGVWVRIWSHILGQRYERVNGRQVPITEKREKTTRIWHSDYNVEVDFNLVVKMVEKLLEIKHNDKLMFKTDFNF